MSNTDNKKNIHQIKKTLKSKENGKTESEG